MAQAEQVGVLVLGSGAGGELFCSRASRKMTFVSFATTSRANPTPRELRAEGRAPRSTLRPVCLWRLQAPR
jgi:hypothetical protein